ncbi:transport permease protein [Cellulomonas chitinilytica]|uniref:Transport permease protein n=1 Tax=Cellulomonas chitinilytica TaxID=398759 RepID=A0A919P4D9_9CELL|nr:ABC transporter permease [Cellulomonas chitinilytica]GIG21169.1 transport permease protein [Cellulomonas chitinilytica]
MSRVGALARAEGTLLRRDPMALITAIGVPVIFVPLLAWSGIYDDNSGGLVAALIAVTILCSAYINLVTALVARRESHVLKRLQTGELRDSEILLGTAAPAIALTWGQSLVGGVLVVALIGALGGSDIPLAAVAVLLGTAVFVLLAIVSTAFTRTPELAQVTTLPGYLIPLFLSGVMFPLDAFPDWVQAVAPYSPLNPVVDLLTIALAGSRGPVLAPLAILVGWLVLSGFAARRWFRWDVRR